LVSMYTGQKRQQKLMEEGEKGVVPSPKRKGEGKEGGSHLLLTTLEKGEKIIRKRRGSIESIPSSQEK